MGGKNGWLMCSVILSEHRAYPNRDVVTEPSGAHFTQPGHNLAHLNGVVSQVRNPDPFV